MAKKYKLKCFRCGYPFKNKEEVCRGDWETHPICMDCLYEEIDHDWDEPEGVLDDILYHFDRNYKKFMKHLYKNYTVCIECDCWMPNEYMEGLICSSCMDEKLIPKNDQN